MVEGDELIDEDRRDGRRECGNEQRRNEGAPRNEIQRADAERVEREENDVETGVALRHIPVFRNAKVMRSIPLQPAGAERIPDAAFVRAACRVERIGCSKEEQPRDEHEQYDARPGMALIAPEAAPPELRVRRGERLRGKERKRVIRAAQHAKCEQQAGEPRGKHAGKGVCAHEGIPKERCRNNCGNADIKPSFQLVFFPPVHGNIIAYRAKQNNRATAASADYSRPAACEECGRMYTSIYPAEPLQSDFPCDKMNLPRSGICICV